MGRRGVFGLSVPLARLVVSQGESDVLDYSLVLSNKAEEPTPNPPFD